MEVILDKFWNKLSVLLGSVFAALHHHALVVPTHCIWWTCTSKQQQSHGWIFPSLLFYLFFVFPLLIYFLLSLLLWAIPFPTYLDSFCSLRWYPAKHTFPPAMAALTSLPLGTLAPLPRDRALGISPITISYSVTPGWCSQPSAKAPSGVRRMVLTPHPVSSAHPTKHYPLLAYVYLCSSDLLQSLFYLIIWVVCPRTALYQPQCFLQ